MPDPKIDFRVVRAERRSTKNGEPYYALELIDASKRKHEARVWSEVIAGTGPDNLPAAGQYWGGVRYKENVFRGQQQLVIEDYSVYMLSMIPEATKSQFVELAVVNAEEVIDRMFHWPFWENDMARLMDRVETDLKQAGVWDKIRSIPAGAAYHHSVKGGFLLHISEMLDFSERLCNVHLDAQGVEDAVTNTTEDLLVVDGPDHYPGLIDYQILRAAIVLHDIG